MLVDSNRRRGRDVFYRSLLIAMMLSAIPALSAVAQRAAPAAVTHARPLGRGRELTRVATDSSHSLPHDMTRGATYGVITGAILAGATVLLISREGDRCCEQPPNQVTFGKSVGIVAAGSTLGALVGAVLGYSYHFNRNPAK
jgi:hypothetical protein